MRNLKPSAPMWAVVDAGSARSLSGILGLNEKNRKIPVGTYFGVVFHKRKFAVELAAKWNGAMVVKIILTQAVKRGKR